MIRPGDVVVRSDRRFSIWIAPRRSEPSTCTRRLANAAHCGEAEAVRDCRPKHGVAGVRRQSIERGRCCSLLQHFQSDLRIRAGAARFEVVASRLATGRPHSKRRRRGVRRTL